MSDTDESKWLGYVDRDDLNYLIAIWKAYDAVDREHPHHEKLCTLYAETCTELTLDAGTVNSLLSAFYREGMLGK